MSLKELELRQKLPFTLLTFVDSYFPPPYFPIVNIVYFTLDLLSQLLRQTQFVLVLPRLTQYISTHCSVCDLMIMQFVSDLVQIQIYAYEQHLKKMLRQRKSYELLQSKFSLIKMTKCLSELTDTHIIYVPFTNVLSSIFRHLLSQILWKIQLRSVLSQKSQQFST